MTVSRFLLILLALSSTAAAADEKLVIAHYMTDMVPQTDRPLVRWIDPELADPQGSTAALGGISQTVPYASLHLRDADLSKAIDFEIRAARQLGVDGFQFYYPLGDNIRALENRYHQIISEFVRLSDTRYPGFKITLCLAHPKTGKPSTEAERIALWSKPIQSLLDANKDSPSWLKEDSGALLFYLWVGDELADGIDGVAKSPAEIRRVGNAYKRLSEAIGIPIKFIYQVRRPIIDPPYTDSILKTFPAVWGWTASEENPAFWDYLAKRCHEKGCTFTQTVYPDYYTSKVYRKGGDHTILSTAHAIAAGHDNIERHYRVTYLAKTQIRLLRHAIDRGATIINYTTWNDFPEGHHLAPESNHNFGPALLLRYFKRAWQTGEATPPRDQAIVFFKKYRHDAKPEHPIPLKVKSASKDVAAEDKIAPVTLLTAPAECFLNGHALGTVEAGLHTRSIPSEPGPVRVRINRDGEDMISFVTPVEITATPSRTDRLTYSYSSEFNREFGRLFKMAP